MFSFNSKKPDLIRLTTEGLVTFIFLNEQSRSLFPRLINDEITTYQIPCFPREKISQFLEKDGKLNDRGKDWIKKIINDTSKIFEKGIRSEVEHTLMNNNPHYKVKLIINQKEYRLMLQEQRGNEQVWIENIFLDQPYVTHKLVHKFNDEIELPKEFVKYFN